jgi:hypothetical protein
MTEALVTKMRDYLEKAPASYISDAVIERWLNSSRTYRDRHQIYSEDYAYDNLSKVYLVTYQYIMNLVLRDGDDAVIAASNYTVDPENGMITFNVGYTIPDAIYASFTYHNFFDALAECWMYMAGLSKISGVVKLADEILPEDYTSREYCIRKYWTYKPSQSIQTVR